MVVRTASDGAGRIYVSQNAEPGLVVLDADGETIGCVVEFLRRHSMADREEEVCGRMGIR